jgi:hypothetical protein
MSFCAIIAFRSPVTLSTDETEFLPAVRDLSRQYCELRDKYGFDMHVMPIAELYFEGGRFGSISYNGRVWRNTTTATGQRALICEAV